MDVAQASADPVICQKTGLRLFRTSGQTVWRVQKSSFGPLNPQERAEGVDRGEWGRWDLPGARTIYAGQSPLGAYMETLAWARSKTLGKLADMFPEDSTASTEDVLAEVGRDWAKRHHMPPGSLARAWREDRCLYRLKLPRAGWLVDLRVSESVSALNYSPDLISRIASQLDAADTTELNLGDLLGRDRDLTTRVAGWVHQQVLEDGNLPHGIIYSSKWGDDLPCYAIWLRKLADGQDESVEPTKRATPLNGQAITMQDDAFNNAVQRLNIKAH